MGTKSRETIYGASVRAAPSGREKQVATQIGRALEAATAEAKALNIFGAPTFVTRGELFWGDDRLEDAIAGHTAGTLTSN